MKFLLFAPLAALLAWVGPSQTLFAASLEDAWRFGMDPWHWTLLGVILLLLGWYFWQKRRIRLHLSQTKQALVREYQELSDGSVEAILMLQNGFKPVYANQSTALMLGMQGPDEVLMLDDVRQIIHPEERERMTTYALNRTLGKSAPERYDVRLLRKDGKVVWMELLARRMMFRGQPTTQLTGMDITQRKQAEIALKESEERYRYLIEDTLLSVIIHRNLKPLWANKAFTNLFGYGSREEILALDSMRSFFTPEEFQRVYSITSQRIQGVPMPSVYEFQALRKDGQPIWVMTTANLISWQGELAVLSHLLDITDRKRMEQKLKDSEDALQRMISNLPGWVFHFRLRPDGTTALEHIQGHYTEILQAIGLDQLKQNAYKMFDLQHPEDRERLKTTMFESATSLRPFSWQGRYYSLKGNLRWNEIQARPQKEPNGDVVWDGLMLDITAKKRMEAELTKMQKLESVSLLAGGIAHDFNNILTAINGNITLASIEAQQHQAPLVSEILGDAERACNQARDLIQQLLTFSRFGELATEPTNIARIVQETVGYSLRGSNVTPKVHLPADLKWVMGDRGQLGQVLNNLVVNAMQAMPKGGALTLTGENILMSELTRVAHLPDGPYVKISVKDEGKGIPKDTLARIFDPYFTTKSSGSGLGLTICSSIIQKHQGWIVATSPPGEGATFSFYLPAIEPPSRTLEDIPNVPMSKASGRVLIMDDDVLMLQMLTKLLVHLGYDPMTVLNGEEALARYQEQTRAKKPFRAVLMDLTIPGGMSSKDTMLQLLEFDRQAKGIVYSDYANDPVLTHYMDYGFKAKLNKPFQLKELKAVLEQVMGS